MKTYLYSNPITGRPEGSAPNSRFGKGQLLRSLRQLAPVALAAMLPLAARAQAGKNGAATISAASTIVNEYTSLSQDATAGDLTISVSSSTLNANNRFSGSLAPGDRIMLIQMQGATINTSDAVTYGSIRSYNSAGRYELLEVASVPSATQITFACGLTNSYTAAGKVQVIRLPRYTTLTISSPGTLTAPAWNGTTGGVVALDVSGNTSVGTTGGIVATGLGFRGGALNNVSNASGNDNLSYRSATAGYGGEKGEGIAGFQTEYDALNGRYGRGAAANGGGGGNSHNAGGGGGANANATSGPAWSGDGNPDRGTGNTYDAAWNTESASFATSTSSGGGRGGYSYSNINLDAGTNGPGSTSSTGWGGDYRQNKGGLGGRPLDYSTGRLFMGGGGGAGDANNGVGSAGGRGGGLVYVLSGGTISGTGSIVADGVGAGSSGNDAPGGGGGGGTVLLNSSGAVSGISVSVQGGTGGTQNIMSNEAEGPGGGGGGGYVGYTSGTFTRTLVGGANGVTTSGGLTEFPPNGATRGGAGRAATFTYNSQCSIVADEQVSISGPTTEAAGNSISYTISVQNNSAMTANNVTTTAQLSKGLTNVTVSGGGSYDPNTGIVTLPAQPTQAGGASNAATYTISFMAPNYSTTLTLSTAVSTSSTDGVAANNTASHSTTITLPASANCTGTAYSGQTLSTGLYTEIYSGYFNDDLTYFGNNASRLTRTDGNVNFPASNSWGDIAVPASNGGTTSDPDLFSTRSRGYITISTAGNYVFTLHSDDASFLWVGNAARATPLVASAATVNHGGQHSPSSKSSAAVYLAAGRYPIQLLYGDNNTTNALTMSYNGPDTGGRTVVVPGAVLCAAQFGGPLPVELTAFEGKAVQMDAHLSWRTASEKNNAHFEVERSLNGRTFEHLGTVRGQGTTAAGASYAFTDAGIGRRVAGSVYYRLRQVDTDGSASFSPVQLVSFRSTSSTAANFYPNPAATTARVSTTALPAGPYTVTVLDMTGRYFAVPTHEEDGSLLLDVQLLPAGAYQVLVRSEAGLFRQPLLKE